MSSFSNDRTIHTGCWISLVFLLGGSVCGCATAETDYGPEVDRTALNGIDQSTQTDPDATQFDFEQSVG